MRTTLDIDHDVLQAAKERAQRERKTTGRVISELARTALTLVESPGVKEREAVYGFRPFESRGRIVTSEMVNKIRDEDAY